MSGRPGLAAERALDLVGLFHPDADAFGRFTAVPAGALPPVARELLDHRSHMTVAMERYHGSPVGLRVIQSRGAAGGRYAREILLTRADGLVVQHGIVRIDLSRLAPGAVADIRSERLPLGRILLAAGLLCDVHDVQLLEVEPGPHLRALFGRGGPTFGRVAEIGVDGSPAIELLEIVAPGSTGETRP